MGRLELGKYAGLRSRDTAVALTADVDVRQNLAAGDDVNFLGHGLEVIQDEPDAVGGVDYGRLRGVELRRRTLNLSMRKKVSKEAVGVAAASTTG